MFQAELKVTAGKQAGSSIPLPQGKFLVGREEDCHLRPNSEMVSRHHCVFTIDEYAVRLRDLGSTNGTIVNGERIRGAVVLKQGDRVSIGKLDFEMVIRDSTDLETKMNIAIESETHTGLPKPVPAESSVGQVVDAAEAAPSVVPTGSDTLAEIPTNMADANPYAGDTVFAPPQQPGMPMQQPPVGYPMGYPQQQFMPYGYPQMGYPQMGYPQMGYPQQMGMYPQPGMPMPGMPMQQPPAPAAPVEPEPAKPVVDNLFARLPDPAATGAKPPEVKVDANGQKAKEDPKIKDVAGDVISKYLNRRPNTGN